MTEATPKDYWISPNALYIERNAMGMPDYIQASCVSGTQILVYIKDIIGYDIGHNYQRWTLQASPTIFNTHSSKYIYAAIPRTSKNGNTNAVIVFPSERIDIYGKNSSEEQIGNDGYYYVFLQGILSSSGDNGTKNREWEQQVNTGYLSSDEAINAGATDTEWYKYSSVDGILTFIKDLTMKAGTKFLQLFAKSLTIVSNGKITFEKQQKDITGVVDTDTTLDSDDKIVTPKYLNESALSKKHDDKTEFDLEMKNLTTHGNVDIFGNTIVKGNLIVGTVESPQKANVYGDFEVGLFNKGTQGAKVDFYGNAEFESIVGRSFLEVPELRYNRTTITVGNKWQTQGAGIIEKVWEGDNLSSEEFSSLEGVACLKLESGEIGAIAVNDKCQGVFHFLNKNNDKSTSDSKDGNFHFAGFTTIYFLIKEIYTSKTLPKSIKETLEDNDIISENQYFRYELRAASCANLAVEDRNRWSDISHPQPTMHFAAYANESNSERQASRLTTTTYQLHLAGMTDWTYTQDNIQLIIGWLDGFSFLQRVWDKEQKKFIEATKELTGEGIATGNMYMWGSINQFDRVPSLVSQQLFFHSTSSLDIRPEEIVVNKNHLSYELGKWQRDPITPSAADRFVWQQWLYSYSDGTYSVSDIAFQAADPTALTVLLNKNLVSVALTDWFDTENPDTLDFDITASLVSGQTPIEISTAIVQYGDGNSEDVKLEYTTDISADKKSVIFHISLKGYIGVSINGSVPENTFLTFTLDSLYGTSSAVVTIVQNREGEDGQNGEKGEKGDKGEQGIQGEKGDQGPQGEHGLRGYDGVSIRRSEWQEDTFYRNDSEDGSTATDGNRYLDEVSVTDLSAGTVQWYLARSSHNGVQSALDNKPSGNGNDYWESINDLRPLRTSYADIMNAFIQFLQVNQIVITDEESQPYGAFGGGKEQMFPLWFGGKTPSEAVTKINRQGDIWSGDRFSVINGRVRADGNESRVEIHDGIVEMYGSFTFPNIKIGVDDDGCAVLEFYDKNGQKMYNLGPNGLDKITTSNAYFTISRLKSISVEDAISTYAEIKNIQERETLPYYQFFPKQTKTGNTIVYWYNNTSSNAAPPQMGLYYKTNGLSANLPTGDLVPDGWYASVNNGVHPMDLILANPDVETTLDYIPYFEFLYHFSNGKQDKIGKLYWKQKNDNGSLYDFNLKLD